MLVFASLGGLLTEIKKNDRLCGGGDGPLGSVQERCYLTCSDFAIGFSKAVTVTRVAFVQKYILCPQSLSFNSTTSRQFFIHLFQMNLVLLLTL